MAAEAHFTERTFRYLRDLAANNEKAWFEAHRDRYEAELKEPALRFIMDFGPKLKEISPEFRADPRPVGGSLFRIHRDLRFTKDKRPYKTHLGIRFPHRDRRARDVHSPGFYLHIEPGSSFVGVGIWHPNSKSLKKIRDYMIDDPDRWVAARDDAGFQARFELAGDSLVRGPRGYDRDHPLIDDLKRKDFIGVAELSRDEVTRDDFLDVFAGICEAGAPLVRFLCRAVDVPF